MSAQFPNAVKSFAARNAGDVIQPSHVNDLQDEVNAIEAGYLQGTAALNSSNSTVRALSVTTGSTFAGPIVLASTATISAGGTVGTAGQVLQSNGSSGVIWAAANANLTAYTPVCSTVANSGSSAAVMTFEVAAGAWASGQKISILAACPITANAGNPTLTLKWRVGAVKVAGAALQQAATSGSTNVLLPFAMLRASTSIFLFTGNSSVTNDGFSMPYTNLPGVAQMVQLISGVDFASTNTVALVALWGTANSSNSFGVLAANVVKL